VTGGLTYETQIILYRQYLAESAAIVAGHGQQPYHGGGGLRLRISMAGCVNVAVAVGWQSAIGQ